MVCRLCPSINLVREGSKTVQTKW